MDKLGDVSDLHIGELGRTPKRRFQASIWNAVDSSGRAKKMLAAHFTVLITLSIVIKSHSFLTAVEEFDLLENFLVKLSHEGST